MSRDSDELNQLEIQTRAALDTMKDQSQEPMVSRIGSEALVTNSGHQSGLSGVNHRILRRLMQL